MSKFSKALEQAERDRGLRPHPSQPGTITPDLREFGPDAELRPPASEPSIPWPAPPRPQPIKESDASARGDGVDEHLVSLLSPNAFEAEQYRALRHAVEQAHKRSGLSVVAITSPTVGDGKTTTAINLAGAVAQAPGVRVLLIDADLRRPSIASRFGLVEPGGPALADLVLDPVLSLDDVVRPRPPFNLSVITAGPPSSNSYEIFQAPRMGQILAEARNRFDYVVLDTPPLVPVLDSRVIGRWVDGYVIVVSCHRTPRRFLAEALNVIEPEKVVGLVFNRSDPVRSSSRYYDYAYSPLRRGPKAGPLGRIMRRGGAAKGPILPS